MKINNDNLKYYIDNNKNDTRKYVIHDTKKNCYYNAFVDVRKENLILKFRLTACFKISNNLTSCNFNQFEKIICNEINFAIDFNKLYLR